MPSEVLTEALKTSDTERPSTPNFEWTNPYRHPVILNALELLPDTFFSNYGQVIIEAHNDIVFDSTRSPDILAAFAKYPIPSPFIPIEHGRTFKIFIWQTAPSEAQGEVSLSFNAYLADTEIRIDVSSQARDPRDNSIAALRITPFPTEFRGTNDTSLQHEYALINTKGHKRALMQLRFSQYNEGTLIKNETAGEPNVDSIIRNWHRITLDHTYVPLPPLPYTTNQKDHTVALDQINLDSPQTGILDAADLKTIIPIADIPHQPTPPNTVSEAILDFQNIGTKTPTLDFSIPEYQAPHSFRAETITAVDLSVVLSFQLRNFIQRKFNLTWHINGGEVFLTGTPTLYFHISNNQQTWTLLDTVENIPDPDNIKFSEQFTQRYLRIRVNYTFRWQWRNTSRIHKITSGVLPNSAPWILRIWQNQGLTITPLNSPLIEQRHNFEQLAQRWAFRNTGFEEALAGGGEAEAFFEIKGEAGEWARLTKALAGVHGTAVSQKIVPNYTGDETNEIADLPYSQSDLRVALCTRRRVLAGLTILFS